MLESIDAVGWQVLIVDDEPDNLGVPSQILEFYGAAVETALDGVQAMDTIKTMEPTLVLLDLSMPRMNGWETIVAIRANDNLKSIPIIAVTAHAMKGDKERVFEAGFDGYVAKPFKLPDLLAEIKRCVDLKSNGSKPNGTRPNGSKP